MKIKLNKEQVSYLNSITDKEAKKEFLFDCFIEACEETLVYNSMEVVFKDGIYKPSDKNLYLWLANCSSTMKLFKEDSNNTKQIAPDLNRNEIIEILHHNPSLDKCIEMKNLCAKIGEFELCAKFRDKEKQLLEKNPPKGESLSKEQLKGITQPCCTLSHYFFDDLTNEWKPILRYSKEDLEKAFNEARKLSPLKGLFTHLKHSSFEEYFKMID